MGRLVGARGLALVAALAAGGCATSGSVSRPLPFPTAPGSNVPASTSASMSPITTSADRFVASGPVVETALDLRGVRYRLGGDSPSTGFDCSGFVRFVFGQHQIEVPRTVAEQVAIGRAIDVDRVEAGDLLFFSTITPGPSHVGIAIGGGAFVHAPGDGGVVRVDRVDAPYWRARTVDARRVF